MLETLSRHLILPLALAALSATAQAQDRQQASLSIDAAKPRQQATLHDNRTRPHGPVGDAGRVTPLLRAMTHHVRGESDRALADYDEALRRDPDNEVARLNRGIVLSTHKAEPRKAIADFNRLLTTTPGNFNALLFRSDAHTRLGDYIRALADLDLAVALAPDSQVHVRRGVVRALLGQPSPAIADYTTALSFDPRNVEALVNRAAIEAARGDTAAALRDLDAALAIAPGNAVARYNRGYVSFARRDYDQAIRDYGTAIDLDPQLGWAYLNRCLTRVVAGRDVGQATGDCDQALKLLPEAPEARETKGFLYLNLGNPEGAQREYDAALALDANRPLALHGRGLARTLKGDLAGGQADKNAARALSPHVARAFASYASN